MTDLRTLAEAATPGPWGGWEGLVDTDKVFIPSATDGRKGWVNLVVSDRPEADAAYIAAANPTVVLALLDVVDAARGLEMVERINYQPTGRDFDSLRAALARYEEVSRDPA